MKDISREQEQKRNMLPVTLVAPKISVPTQELIHQRCINDPKELLKSQLTKTKE
jgi:hypothetical protein